MRKVQIEEQKTMKRHGNSVCGSLTAKRQKVKERIRLFLISSPLPESHRENIGLKKHTHTCFLYLHLLRGFSFFYFEHF